MHYPPWLHATPALGHCPLSHNPQPQSEQSLLHAWVGTLGVGAWLVIRPADASWFLHHRNIREKNCRHAEGNLMRAFLTRW